MDTKPYLDYLDKEMTIMGILSAFCVAAPAGILSAVLAKEGAAPLFWQSGPIFIVAGAVLCFLAALFFYKQRSQLAWYYGQICLTQALNATGSDSAELREWLRNADSWETWWPYSWGFTFLNAGFVQFLTAIFCVVHPHWSWLISYIHQVSTIMFFSCLVVAAIAAILQWYVLTHNRFSDEPWSEFAAGFRTRVSGQTTLPHDGVYTRLMPSATHGVGVFAIIDIPKGKYVFEPDDDALVSINASQAESLPAPIRKLYEDFCVLEDDIYACPSSLNLLTPSWFLNTSKHPNMAADSSLRFYALRDIAAGEELTADYEAYSENQTDVRLRQPKYPY